MSNKHKSKNSNQKDNKNNNQNQDQDQDQKQDQLQAQLQGQAQGQAQGQGQLQFAVQSVDTKVDNDNKNDNSNDNKNENTNEVKNDIENKLDNSVDNKLDNSIDNKVENSIDNKIENTVETKVETTVDVKVDLDLDLDAFERPVDNDVIDIEQIQNIGSSVIMPDAVTQTLHGSGNQFNIDQVNNIYDKDQLWDPDVRFDGKGDFKQDAWAHGGDVKFEDPKVDINGNGATFGDGLAAAADGIASNEAFTQNIVMGANIQFNNIEISAAGNDFADDHSI